MGSPPVPLPSPSTGTPVLGARRRGTRRRRVALVMVSAVIGTGVATVGAEALPVRAAVPAPTPTQGPTGGGTIVTITGTGLTGATAVNFGPTPATVFAVIDDNTIQATAPPGAAGATDVTVTSPTGTSGISTADHFTYVVPAAGSYQGMQPSRSCDTRPHSAFVAVNQCNNGGSHSPATLRHPCLP